MSRALHAGAEEGPRRGWSSAGAVTLVGLVAVLTLKQVAVNALGSRHLVAQFVQAALLMVVVGAVIAVLADTRAAIRRAAPLLVAQFCLVLWWTVLAVAGPGGDPAQRVVALCYDAVFTMLIWAPVAWLRSARELRLVQRALGGAAALLALIGILQWMVPDAALPGLLRSDATVALSATTFGTARVNGLIGTSIDFGLMMTIGLGLAYLRLQRSWSPVAGVIAILCLTGVVLSGSRAAWLGSAAVLLLSTRLRRLPVLFIGGVALALAARFVLPDGYLTAPLDRPLLYQGSDALRVGGIQATLEALRTSPVFGTGIGFQSGPSFDQLLPQKVITDGFWWAVMLEGGVIGFGLLMACFAVLGLLFGWLMRRPGPPAGLPAAGGLALLALGFYSGLINSALVNQATNAGFYLVLGTCLAGALLELEPPAVPAASPATPFGDRPLAAAGAG